MRILKKNGGLVKIAKGGKSLVVKFHQCKVELLGEGVMNDGKTIGDHFEIKCKIDVECGSCGDSGSIESTNHAIIEKGNRAALEGVCGSIINQMIMGTEKEGDGRGYGLRHIVIGVRCPKCKAKMLEVTPAIIMAKSDAI